MMGTENEQPRRTIETLTTDEEQELARCFLNGFVVQPAEDTPLLDGPLDLTSNANLFRNESDCLRILHQWREYLYPFSDEVSISDLCVMVLNDYHFEFEWQHLINALHIYGVDIDFNKHQYVCLHRGNVTDEGYNILRSLGASILVVDSDDDDNNEVTGECSEYFQWDDFGITLNMDTPPLYRRFLELRELQELSRDASDRCWDTGFIHPNGDGLWDAGVPYPHSNATPTSAPFTHAAHIITTLTGRDNNLPAVETLLRAADMLDDLSQRAITSNCFDNTDWLLNAMYTARPWLSFRDTEEVDEVLEKLHSDVYAALDVMQGVYRLFEYLLRDKYNIRPIGSNIHGAVQVFHAMGGRELIAAYLDDGVSIEDIAGGW